VRIPDQPAADATEVLRDHAREHDAHVLQLTPPEFDHHDRNHRIQVRPNTVYAIAVGVVEKFLCLVPLLPENLHIRVGLDKDRPVSRRAVCELKPKATCPVSRFQFQGGEGLIHSFVIVNAVCLRCRMPIPAIDGSQDFRDGHVVHHAGTVNRKPRRHPLRLLWPNDCVHLPGRLQGRGVSKNRNGGQVKCNALLAPASHKGSGTPTFGPGRNNQSETSMPNWMSCSSCNRKTCASGIRHARKLYSQPERCENSYVPSRSARPSNTHMPSAKRRYASSKGLRSCSAGSPPSSSSGK